MCLVVGTGVNGQEEEPKVRTGVRGQMSELKSEIGADGQDQVTRKAELGVRQGQGWEQTGTGDSTSTGQTLV